METLIVLGVKKIILVGMCGSFDDRVNVGGAVIPNNRIKGGRET